MRQIQHFFQGQLFVDGIGAVECTAVCSLHTLDTGMKILAKRVISHGTEVVEANVGRDLELKHGTGIPEIGDKLSALDGAQIGSV